MDDDIVIFQFVCEFIENSNRFLEILCFVIIYRFSHGNKKNDCKSKYLFWRRVHMIGTLLGRRKDKNGRLYLSITIH